MINVCAGILRDHGAHYVRWARDGGLGTPFRLLRAAINMPPPFMELGEHARASLLGVVRGAARSLQRERASTRAAMKDLQEQVQAGLAREAHLAARLTAEEAARTAAEAEAAASAGIAAAAQEAAAKSAAEARSAVEELRRRPKIDTAAVRRCLALALAERPGPGLRRDMRNWISRLTPACPEK